MNFFFDANCNRKLIGVVRALVSGHVFEGLWEQFPLDAKDPVWIEALRKRPEPWIVVSGDNVRIEVKAKASVLKDSDLTWVMLVGKFNNQQFDVQARRIAEAWPRLCRMIEKQQEPTVYKVKQDPYRRKNEPDHRIMVERYRLLRDL